MFGKSGLVVGILALGAVVLPAAALADDPRDRSMRSVAARARDSAIIKRMNQDRLAYVRRRDNSRMESFRTARGQRDARYADARADYEREMKDWRHAVAACRAGRYEYCDR